MLTSCLSAGFNRSEPLQTCESPGCDWAAGFIKLRVSLHKLNSFVAAATWRLLLLLMSFRQMWHITESLHDVTRGERFNYCKYQNDEWHFNYTSEPIQLPLRVQGPLVAVRWPHRLSHFTAEYQQVNYRLSHVSISSCSQTLHRSWICFLRLWFGVIERTPSTHQPELPVWTGSASWKQWSYLVCFLRKPFNRKRKKNF